MSLVDPKQEEDGEGERESEEWQQYKPEDFGADAVPAADPEAELRAAIKASLADAPPLGPPTTHQQGFSVARPLQHSGSQYPAPAEHAAAAGSGHGLTNGVDSQAAPLKPEVSLMLSQMVRWLLIFAKLYIGALYLSQTAF